MNDSAVQLCQDLRNDFGEDEIANMILANVFGAHGSPVWYYTTSKYDPNRYSHWSNEAVHCSMIDLQSRGYVKLYSWRKYVGFCVPAKDISSPKTNTYAEPIILRESKAIEYSPFFGEQRKTQRINYQDTPDSIAMRKALIRYNDYMSAQVVTARGQRYPTSLRRVFNDGKWSHGGRFYDSGSLRYQDLAGSIKPNRIPRSEILINGNKTVELDYTAIHPTIIFLREGLDVPVDPYSFDGYNRANVKLAFNISINSHSEEDTIGSLTHKFGWTRELADATLAAIKNHLPILAKYLSSGEGVILQRSDSNIAARIMRDMTLAKIPMLVVHDSFIVECKHEASLRDLMRIQFQTELNTDYIPRIK